MIIRPFKKSDLSFIKLIEPHFSESEFTQENAVILVAEDNNQILGFIDFWVVENEISIIEIAVHQDLRRQGIATKLFNAMLIRTPSPQPSPTRGEGVTVNLEVRAFNTPAKKFYEKLGFRVIGVRNNYYANGENAIVMQRHVKSEE